MGKSGRRRALTGRGELVVVGAMVKELSNPRRPVDVSITDGRMDEVVLRNPLVEVNSDLLTVLVGLVKRRVPRDPKGNLLEGEGEDDGV